MFLMENVSFNQEDATIETHQVKGYLLIYSDDSDVMEVNFNHKVKIHFVLHETLKHVAAESSTSVPHPVSMTDVKCEDIQVDVVPAENEGTFYDGSSEEDIGSKSLNDLTSHSADSVNQLTSPCSIVLKPKDDLHTSAKVPRNPSIVSKLTADYASDVIGKSINQPNTSILHVSKSVADKTNTSLYGLHCQLCNSWFPNTIAENKHKRNPDTQSSCGQCPAVYPCKADLFSHIYEMHNFIFLKNQFPECNLLDEIQWPKDRKRITCPMCGHVTSYKYLKYHIDTHFDDLSYKCCLCGCALRNGYSYAKHCKEHVPELPSLIGLENREKETMAIQKVSSTVKVKNSNTQSKNTQEVSKIKIKKNVCVVDERRETTGFSEIELRQESDPNCLDEVIELGVRDKEEQREHHCIYCKKTFSSQKQFRLHRVTSSLNLKCHMCGVALPSQALLIIHEYEVHRLPCILAENDNEAGKDYPTESRRRNTNKQQRCRGKQFVACPVCTAQVTRFTLPLHIMRRHTNESPFKCCICNHPCSSIRIYKLHCDEHNGQLRRGYFHCSSCPAVFNNKSDLHKHAVVHKRICHFCNVDFEHVNLLEVHYNTEHFNEMLKCKHCNKRFANEHKLKEHERHHRFTTARPCPKCGIMVKRLKVHLLRRHPEPGVEFLCSLCPKKYTNEVEFNNHLRRHNDSENGVKFTCPKCQKTFSCRSYLNDHIKVHLTRKLYDCPICGKQCTEKYNLKIHMRIHSSHKLFHCDQCGQGFNYKASLISHQKSKHKLITS